MTDRQSDPLKLGSLNSMAVAGFVCAFMCTAAGLVMSIIALRQIKKGGGVQTGRGLALAGLAVSMIKISAWIVLGMLGLVYGKDIPSLVELFPGL